MILCLISTLILSVACSSEKVSVVWTEGDVDPKTGRATHTMTVLKGRELKLEYGLLENKKTAFSFGTRAKADMMGIYEEGKYEVNSSAGWVEEKTFAILAQVTDTYFGLLAVHIAFDGETANMVMRRSGQYVFEEIDGFMVADLKK